MKIHAYNVSAQGAATLDTLFTQVQGYTLEQRLRSISGSEIRVEAAEQRNNLWFVDFGGIRPDGPGRASAATPIEDFDLDDTEGFAHETAALYDPASSFIVMQYNHFGPRSGRIQAYLSMLAREMGNGGPSTHPEGDGFAFFPVLKPSAADRLNSMGIVKNVEFSFYVPGVLANDGGQRQALGALLNNPLIGSADRVRIQLAASRDRAGSLAVNHVRQVVSDLLGVRDELFDLSVMAKETEESPTEPVDLVEARLEADIPVQRIGRRYGRDERWQVLQQAFATWRANGQLT